MMIEAIVDAKYYWDNRYYEKVGSEVKDITDELPFEIPDNWVWTRLESSVLINPRNDLSDNIDVSFVEMKSISDGYNNHFSATTRLWKEVKSGFTHFQDGDVGFAKITPCFQNRKSVVFSGLQNGYGAGTTELHILRAVKSTITTEYLLLFVKSSYFIERGIQKFSGTAGQQRFGTDEVKKTPFPLPPLEEQARIVNRIDELFEQIDIIEQNQADIDTLYDEFRKRTLTLAIQGKLVPQEPNDEPASVLLERIRAEKKAKLGKKYVDSYIYKGDDNYYYEHIAGREQDELVEVPFDIPDSWAWVRWGNLSFSIQYGYNAPAKESGRIKMVRISDIHNNEVDWEHVPFCDINETDIKTYLLKENDILFARTGGTVGKSYLVTCVPEEAIYAGYLIRTQYSAQLSAQYLKYFMESSLYWMQLKDGTIATAQPNCNGQTLSKMILPLPPLAEQKRVVAKINEIFAML